MWNTGVPSNTSLQTATNNNWAARYDSYLLPDTAGTGNYFFDVQASDGAKIGAGAGDLTAGTAPALGAAVVVNEITDTAAASINNAEADTDTGLNADVSVTAVDSSAITAVAVGVVAGGSPIAGSVAVNQIDDSTTAIITGSHVNARGAVNVEPDWDRYARRAPSGETTGLASEVVCDQAKRASAAPPRIDTW